MALPRPLLAFRKEKHSSTVQADHPWPAVVCHTAGSHRAYVYGSVRRHSRHPHRRCSAAPVLSGRRVYVAVLCGLPQHHIEHLRNQRQYLRQGLFPAPHNAGIQRAQQPAALRHTVRPVRHSLCGICLHRLPRVSQLVRPAVPAACGYDGRPGPGLRHPDKLHDHQVPRPPDTLHLHSAALDVRHPNRLSSQPGAGQGQGRNRPLHRNVPEPRDPRDRDLQIRLPWCRQLHRLGLACLLIPLYGRPSGPGRSSLQQGAEVVHGHRVKSYYLWQQQ